MVYNEEMTLEQKYGHLCQHFAYYNKILSRKNPEYFAENEKDKGYLEAYQKCFKQTKPLYLGMIRHYAWIEKALSTPIEKLIIKVKTQSA